MSDNLGLALRFILPVYSIVYLVTAFVWRSYLVWKRTSLAYKVLEQTGYRNMRVLREGIPGWQQKGYPLEGRRTGAVEHRPYPEAVVDLERRLTGRRAAEE
jgi:3-mercaptopyruvate sulfurtransferase SseA